MLELKYNNKIHLDKWDIDVVPYLTVENMEAIINDLINCSNGMERKMRLIADVIVACTDLYDDDDANYTYEQVLYSGLWDDMLESCPYLCDNIKTIENEVKEWLSAERAIMTFFDTITSKVNNLDIDLKNIDLDKIKATLETLQSVANE